MEANQNYPNLKTKFRVAFHHHQLKDQQKHYWMCKEIIPNQFKHIYNKDFQLNTNL
jgi:hypothetical protein